MGLFTKDVDVDTISNLSGQIARLEGALAVKQEESDLTDQNNALREEVSKRKIELAEIEEKHKAEIRDVEHKVGLQQQKADQDQKAAVKEAELKVREANLESDKGRFESQMKFEREHLQNQIGGLEKMVANVMSLVPKHTVNENINRNFGETPEGEKPALESGD